MRWSRERSLAAPLPYLTFWRRCARARPTYPPVDEREDDETRWRRGRPRRLQHPPCVDLPRERNKLLYLWKYTRAAPRRATAGWRCLYAEVGPLERRRDDHVPPTTPTFVPPDRRSALHHACTASIRSDGCDRAAQTKLSDPSSFGPDGPRFCWSLPPH